MKRYKRFKEGFLENQAVDKLANEIKKQYDKDSDLNFTLSFEDFIYSFLYACDYKGASSIDKDVRKFLSIYTDIDDENFQDQDSNQIKEYISIFKKNFNRFDTDWKTVIKMAFSDLIFDIVSDEEGCTIKDCENVLLIVLGKKLTSGSFITLTFK